VRFDVGALYGACIICALAGDIDQAIVDDERRDHLRAVGGLAFVVELFDF
jgi:hypothetical protein